MRINPSSKFPAKIKSAVFAAAAAAAVTSYRATAVPSDSFPAPSEFTQKISSDIHGIVRTARAISAVRFDSSPLNLDLFIPLFTSSTSSLGPSGFQSAFQVAFTVADYKLSLLRLQSGSDEYRHKMSEVRDVYISFSSAIVSVVSYIYNPR